MKSRFVVFVLLLCVFLTGCSTSASAPVSSANTSGTQPTTGSTGTTPAPSGGSPTVLRVTRTDPSATNNIGPLDKTVTDAATVQQLYTTALKAPTYPTGTSISQSCLNDTGVIYHLDFLQGTNEVQHMNLDPGNCKILYLSPSDLRQASDSFLNQLKQALQLNSLTAN